MPTAEKAQTIDELTQKLRDSHGAVLLDYRGLNVGEGVWATAAGGFCNLKTMMR